MNQKEVVENHFEIKDGGKLWTGQQETANQQDSVDKSLRQNLVQSYHFKKEATEKYRLKQLGQLISDKAQKA